MTKVDLINAVADIGLTKKKAGEVVNCVLDTIKDSLSEGDKVQLIGFGSFEVKERPARRGRNPQNGEAIDIPAKKVPVFRAGEALKQAVL
ncbi:HU family DNA-binding protein [bacterium]|nr:HU family DNA-binding protein [bacterium]MBU0899529.1 HU family DNA-binding protein [bacterium]MBU1152733.1 HU family DNA-binding protein [bacterium]MBU1782498.1 HU family DNA-binding protein [bacterium]MBU2599538.1 HU family DNA-binding protein [bacterium]